MNVPDWHKEAARIYASGKLAEWRTPDPINPTEGGEMSDLHLLDTGCKWCGCRIFIEAPVIDPGRYASDAVINKHHVDRFAAWMQSLSPITMPPKEESQPTVYEHLLEEPT